MVIIQEWLLFITTFTEEDNYNQDYFTKYFYNLKLSDFQKWAIKSIVDGDNVLITAHTGSGKTLPAEFAIQHLISKGKKLYIQRQSRRFLTRNCLIFVGSFQLFPLEF